MDVLLSNVSLHLQSRSLTGKVEAESQILHNVSVPFARGKLHAIMGGSGSGKTSLIDIVMGRVGGGSSADAAAGSSSGGDGTRRTGTITFDGGDPAPLIPRVCAYVKQGDFLLPHLTARETLQFAARLRLPAELSDEERERRVDDVISELGLRECADTRVGSELARGLSGGEKRRVSIGVQLLTDPRLLVLDEPTTGLDSFTAHNLIEYLVKLAAQNRTVICSIHQPRSDIFNLFDSILLLARGHVLYSGATAAIVPYFAARGVPCPAHSNPADLILDAASIDHRSPAAERESRARLRRLARAWLTHAAAAAVEAEGAAGQLVEAKKDAAVSEVAASDAVAAAAAPAAVSTSAPLVPSRASTCRQISILTHRACLNLWRDRLTTIGLVVETVVLSVILGGIYYQIPLDTIAGMRSRTSFLYLLSSVQTYLLLIFSLFVLQDELAVFDRERSDHMYDAVPWIVARWLSTIPINFALPLILSLIIYPMVGLRTDLASFQNFWVFAAVQVGVQFCSTAFALFCAAINRPFAKSSLLANSFFTFFGLSSGFFAQTSTIPDYISWFRHISWVYWGNRLLCINEFADRTFPCAGPAAYCAQYFEGNAVLASQAIPSASMATPAGAIALIAGTLGVAAAIVLHFYHQSPGGGGGGSVSAETMATRRPLVLDENEDEDEGDKDANGKREGKEGKAAESAPVVALEMTERVARGAGVTVTISDVSVSLRSEGGQQVEAASATDASVAGKSVISIANDPPASGGDRHILQSVSAHCAAGSLTVIMGGSGSGKSTLLNALANRSDAIAHSTGRVLFNGLDWAASQHRRHGITVSYVMQADYLIPTLTVRETLRYAAALRLPSRLAESDRWARVEAVIADLGLSECADTRVGSEETERGISGGERRRTSIAVQMLSDPSVLLLDEPTSGLDSTSACHLMRTLRRLATDRGRTVIASIHQPRSDLYALFDQILLLSRGHVVYAGAAGDAMLRHFGTLGHDCPPLFNPSDWVLDLSSVDLRNAAAEAESRARVAALIEGYKASSALQAQLALVQGVLSAESESSSSSAAASSSLPSAASPPAESDADADPDNESSTASCWKAFPVLASRSFVHFGRSPIIISARIFQVLSYALILAIYFAPMGNDQRFIQNRLGLLQQYTPILFIGMLNCFAVFINERNVFWRERADGAYETAPFFLSYMCGELPFEVLGALLFSVVVGPLIGMGASASQFFVTCFTTLCVLFAGESIGILFCAFIRHAGFAVSLVNSVLTTFTIMAGLMSFDMSPILRTVNYISVMRYAARLNVVYEFRGSTLTCTPDQLLANGQCPITSGDQVLALYGFDASASAEAVNWALVAALPILYRVIAFIALKYNRNAFTA